MRTARSRESYLAEAARLCRKHGGVFYTVTRNEFRLYRRHPSNQSPIYIAKRNAPDKLVRLIRDVVAAH